MVLTSQDFDLLVRQHVYEVTLRRGYPPSQAEAASGLQVTASLIRDAFRQLAEAHVLVLQPESGEVLMASPFSALPTPFLVELDSFACFGNCIWDALGIAAMLKQDASIRTACPDCGVALNLAVTGGVLKPANGIVHFALPALRWWDNIVFT